MTKKRDRLEIIHDILLVIRERGDRVKPTHILYKSNLSHQRLQEYMTELIGKGFIIEKQAKGGGKTYELTDKGFNYLRDYATIRNFMESYGLGDEPAN
ncbi:MAG TPA: winged helix-turn-helix domain-containing protein [Candidatus Nanoarchaeia archaeon]|nr:winged helix-turn-helix domain-containing protein [Candidatus Nanoarchaeia archaeon]